jgi:vacuolar-type H+-ATPase subunit H
MPTAGDILRRFRFHGVPGAPATSGVPVDRARQVALELAPLFALLEDTEQHAARIIEHATQDAVRQRAAGSEEAQQILAVARSDAHAARAQSAAIRLDAAEAERTALLAHARGEADRILRVGNERIPALVEELVGRVLAMGEHSTGLPGKSGPGSTRLGSNKETR